MLDPVFIFRSVKDTQSHSRVHDYLSSVLGDIEIEKDEWKEIEEEGNIHKVGEPSWEVEDVGEICEKEDFHSDSTSPTRPINKKPLPEINSRVPPGRTTVTQPPAPPLFIPPKLSEGPKE